MSGAMYQKKDTKKGGKNKEIIRVVNIRQTTCIIVSSYV
jgi:hypothetical protein